MKKYLKSLMPTKLFIFLKRLYYKPSINKELRHQRKQLLLFSSTFSDSINSKLSNLSMASHVLEKGITMPNRRLGFGFDRVRDIIHKCNEIISLYGKSHVELQAALATLKQYLHIHVEAEHQLPDDIIIGIESLMKDLVTSGETCYYTTCEDYFKKPVDFLEFAQSRRSVRWFEDSHIDEKTLYKAIHLAQTAPSTCNMQTTRVKIVSSPLQKELLCKLQNGNRGFGDKADKWLLITSDLRCWSHVGPHDPFLDAGIFTMNLLYALHYYGIVACTLNAHLSIQHRKTLQKAFGYPESEVPMVFVAIGNPVKKFMIPKRVLLKTEDIIQRI